MEALSLPHGAMQGRGGALYVVGGALDGIGRRDPLSKTRNGATGSVVLRVLQHASEHVEVCVSPSKRQLESARL